MGDVTPRLKNRISRDFPGSADEVRRLSQLPPGDSPAGEERVMAGVVLASAGRWDVFVYYLRLATEDWRDVLVAGGLANEDWRVRLDAELPGQPSLPGDLIVRRDLVGVDGRSLRVGQPGGGEDPLDYRVLSAAVLVDVRGHGTQTNSGARRNTQRQVSCRPWQTSSVAPNHS